MCRNVMIPFFLLERTISLLKDIEPPVYSESRFEYFNILWALGVKIQKVKFNKSYAKIITDGEFGNERDFCVECIRKKNYPFVLGEVSDFSDLPF